MKFALFVILGLCAVAAHASFEVYDFDVEDFEPHNAVTDQIRAKIEEFIKKASEQLGVIGEKIAAIANKLREDAKDLIMKGKERLDQAKDIIRNKIDDLKKKGGAFAECAKKLEPEYKMVHDEAMSGLKKCAEEVKVAKGEHREQAEKAVAAIKTNLHAIRELVSGCLQWNPMAASKCLIEKSGELRKLAGGVMSSMRDALKVSRQRAHDVLAKAKECNRVVFSNAAAKVKELNKKLAECSQSIEFEFY